MLIETPVAHDDQVRTVDVLRFTASHADSVVQPAEVQTDADNDSNHADGTASDEHDLFDDSGAPEYVNPEPETAAPEEGRGESSSAAQPANQADNEADSVEQVLEPAAPIVDGLRDNSEDEEEEETFDISSFEATTSAHDDWLHRGPFLFDMDFHTYMRFTVRKPRPKNVQISDADRVEHVFLFDSHYALSASHWQELQTIGCCRLVVMEALRCPPPSLNNGEDNAVFKSLIGTLIKCPGAGRCADPLFCSAGFFQVNVFGVKAWKPLCHF